MRLAFRDAKYFAPIDGLARINASPSGRRTAGFLSAASEFHGEMIMHFCVIGVPRTNLVREVFSAPMWKVFCACRQKRRTVVDVIILSE